MNNQNPTTILQRLQKLNELYYGPGGVAYEAALQSAIQQLQRILPDFTIALAEIYTAGSERQAHGGMRHVLLPVERSLP